jgi:hypothetical protein
MNQTTPATTDGTSDAIISDFLEVVDSTAPSDTHEAAALSTSTTANPHRRSKSNCGIQAPMSPISAND